MLYVYIALTENFFYFKTKKQANKKLNRVYIPYLRFLLRQRREM